MSVYQCATQAKRKCIPPTKKRSSEPDVPGEDFHDDDLLAMEFQKNSSNVERQIPAKGLRFELGHPLRESHYLQCTSPDPYCLPNFAGDTLPRRDQGDTDYYCCVMLTLFKPWRTGKDLKKEDETWKEAFDRHVFTPKQT